MKEAYVIMMMFLKMAFYHCNVEVAIRSDHAPLQNVIKNKSKNILTQNLAFEIFSNLPYITFQHIKGLDNILVDSLGHLQHLELYKKPPEKPGEEFGIIIFHEGEIIHEHT